MNHHRSSVLPQKQPVMSSHHSLMEHPPSPVCHFHPSWHPMRQHLHRPASIGTLWQQMCKASAPLLVISIAGKSNDMADVATDPAMQKLSPTLLSYLNTKFKQETSWEEFHFPPRLISHAMSSLQGGAQLTLESWRRLPGLVKKLAQMVSLRSRRSQSRPTTPNYRSSHQRHHPHSQYSLHGSGQVTTAMDIKSKFKESLKRSRPSARPSKVEWLDKEAQSIKAPTYKTSKSSDHALRRQDPPVVLQLALPVAVLFHMAESA